MGLLDGILSRFKRQPSLWNLKLDDLNRERITLQTQQSKLDRESDRLHRDEASYKGDYAEATTPAQKIKDLKIIEDRIELRHAWLKHTLWVRSKDSRFVL